MNSFAQPKKIYISTIPLQVGGTNIVDYRIDPGCGFENPKEQATGFPIITLMRNTVEVGDEIGVILIYENDVRTKINFAPLLAEIERVCGEYSLVTVKPVEYTFYSGLRVAEDGKVRVEITEENTRKITTPAIEIINTDTEESISGRNKLISKLESAIVEMRNKIAENGNVELYIDYTFGEKPVSIVMWDLIDEMELYDIATPYCVYGALNFYDPEEGILYNYSLTEKIRNRTIGSMKGLLNLPGMDPKKVEEAALKYVKNLADPDDDESGEE